MLDGEEMEARCLRGELAPNTELIGPAVCALLRRPCSSERGWRGVVDAHGTAILRAEQGEKA